MLRNQALPIAGNRQKQEDSRDNQLTSALPTRLAITSAAGVPELQT